MNHKKQNVLFVLFAYMLIWLAAILLMLLQPHLGDGIVMPIVVIGSWTPTMALLILFKKLYPGAAVKSFFVNAFKERLNVRIVLFVTFLQIFISVGAAGIATFAEKVSLISLLDLSLQSVIMGLIVSLITGATGEESGWRGFLQQSIEKSFGVIKTSVIVGLVWTFWHMPQWILIDGIRGVELIAFVVLFSVLFASMSIIIGVCYNRCRNLIIPILIHFMFNFTMTAYNGNMAVYAVSVAVLYILSAAGYIVWHRIYGKRGGENK